MKKLIIATLISIAAGSGFAQEGPQNSVPSKPVGMMENGPMRGGERMERHMRGDHLQITKENFQEHKKRILDHMQKMDDMHKKQKTCVEAAQAPDDLKKCREDIKEFHKGIREDMRKHHEEMKQKRPMELPGGKN